MQTFQTWIGVGHTTHDVETHVAESGTVVGKFTLACNYERFSRDAEPTREVLFQRCIAFGKTAEFLQRYAPKGSLLTVQGRLRENKWTDKNTNEERSFIECVIDQARLLKAARGEEQGYNVHTMAREAAPGDDGDLGPVAATKPSFASAYDIDPAPAQTVEQRLKGRRHRSKGEKPPF